MPKTINHDGHAAHLDTPILRADRRNNFNWCENCRGWFEPISQRPMNPTELTAIEVQAIDIPADAAFRAGFRFMVEAIATDPNDTTKAASMFVCACYNKEVAEMIAEALRLAAAYPACTGCGEHVHTSAAIPCADCSLMFCCLDCCDEHQRSEHSHTLVTHSPTTDDELDAIEDAEADARNEDARNA